MARCPLFAALAVFAVACGKEEPAAEASGGSPSSEPAPAPTVPSRFLGHLVLDGVADFIPCGTNAPIPVDGPAFADLVDLHATLTPGEEPFEGLFVDLLAEPRSDERGEWLDVLVIHRASWEGWGCARDEEAIVLEASGSEPDWTLTVEADEMTWRTPDGVKRFVHPGPYPLARGGWAVETSDTSGPRAEFHLGACSNPMSGAYAHLTVTVTLEGLEFLGCGFLGPWVEGQG